LNLTLSAFVGSSFLAFRRLFLDLRTFIESSLVLSCGSVSALFSASKRTLVDVQAARRLQRSIIFFLISRRRQQWSGNVDAAR
jgi:hypothetical protein